MAPVTADVWPLANGVWLLQSVAVNKAIGSRILEALTTQDRTQQGRHLRPSAGIIDAQSVKTAKQGTTIGYDAGKKVKVRKRHLLVDTDGRVLEGKVTAASVSDADGLKALLQSYGAHTECPDSKKCGSMAAIEAKPSKHGSPD